MARQNTYTLTDTHTYAANTTTQIDIPETGYISHISCLLKLVTVGGSIVTLVQDGVARLIGAMSISAAGGKNYYDITDGRQGFYKEYLRLEGKPNIPSAPVVAGATTTTYLELIIHPGLNPFDPYDRSVIIPGAELSNLKHKISWAAASAVASAGITISSGELTVTVNEWQLDPGESRDSLFPGGINVPLYEAREISLAAAKSNLGQVDDVPVGSVLNSIFIMQEDSSDDRTDDEIDEVGVLYPKQQRATPFRLKWYPLKYRSKSHYSIPTMPAGMTLLPLEWVSRRAVGLDLTAAMVGDVQLALTTLVGTGDIHLLYHSISLG